MQNVFTQLSCALLKLVEDFTINMLLSDEQFLLNKNKTVFLYS